MAELTATGNLGGDAELKTTQNGSNYLTFNIKDSKSKKNDQGGWDELKGQWLRITVWGSLAEQLFNSGLLKGSRVRIVGEFYAREYDGQNGPGYSLDVTAWGVQVLKRPNDAQQSPDSTSHQSGGYGVPQSNQPPQNQPQQGGGWNQPGADPWSAPANPGGSWGNQQ